MRQRARDSINVWSHWQARRRASNCSAQNTTHEMVTLPLSNSAREIRWFAEGDSRHSRKERCVTFWYVCFNKPAGSGASSRLINPHVDRESEESSGIKISELSELLVVRSDLARFIACRWSFELCNTMGSIVLRCGGIAYFNVNAMIEVGSSSRMVTELSTNTCSAEELHPKIRRAQTIIVFKHLQRVLERYCALRAAPPGGNSADHG